MEKQLAEAPMVKGEGEKRKETKTSGGEARGGGEEGRRRDSGGGS